MSKVLKILFVTSRLPTHLSSGDRLRAYYLIKGLAKRGHVIDLLGFDDLSHPRQETDIHILCRRIVPVHHDDLEMQHISRKSQMRDMLQGARYGYPRRVWQFHSSTMQLLFQELITKNSYDILHFSEIGVAELVHLTIGKDDCAKVFDLIDAVSLSIRNSLLYRFDLTWLSRLVEAYQTKKFEMDLIKIVDSACVVSKRDYDHLGNSPRMRVINIGVDVPDYVQEIEKVFDLLFTGNMTMRANVDAILWFTKQVWPLVRQKRPATSLYIVGKDPPPNVRSLASDQVIVTGSVPNINWYHARARVFIAPLRYGAGQKIKLLEAFTHALPVVATHEANEGLGAQDGISILLKESPQEMSAAILELLEDERKRLKIGLHAYQFLCENYNLERSTDLLENLYAEALNHAHSDAHAKG